MVVILQVLNAGDKQDWEFSFVRGLLEQRLVEPKRMTSANCSSSYPKSKWIKPFLFFKQMRIELVPLRIENLFSKRKGTFKSSPCFLGINMLEVWMLVWIVTVVINTCQSKWGISLVYSDLAYFNIHAFPWWSVPFLFT